MSNSRGSMEIMDVLSSIRRLVSEDRRADVAPRTEPVLTGPADVQVPEAVADSLAAEAGAEPETVLPAPETGAEPAPVEAEVMMPSLAARRPGESRFVLTAALRVGDEGEPTAGPAEAAPPLADKGAGTRLSLESTIAELEAAVAGIEAEFEPDGGDEEAHAELAEAGPMPSWPLSEGAPAVPPRAEVPPAIEAAAEPVAEVPDSQPTTPRGGFHGVMAGFDVMPPAEDRLDLPITGDITVPTPRRGDDWSAAGAGAGAASAFFRTAARPISATVVTSPETLAAAPTAGAEAAVPAPDDSALPAFEAEVDDLADAAPPEEPEKEARSLSRPVIVRARGAEPGPATTEAGADEDAADVSARADVDADGADDLMAGGAEAETDEEADLFDPLSGADLDIDMLRDMVAEIVRDELRGTLGERITRNLRALVRREIDRALIAEGLKRD